MQDFDGVVAGASAFSFNNLTSCSYHFLPLTGTEGSATFVPLEKLPVIHQDVLKQCDELDRVAYGILGLSELHYYDPIGLVCSQSQNASCLTSVQADTVCDIYSPLLASDRSPAHFGCGRVLRLRRRCPRSSMDSALVQQTGFHMPSLTTSIGILPGSSQRTMVSPQTLALSTLRQGEVISQRSRTKGKRRCIITA